MAFLTDIERAIKALILATGFNKFDENNPSAKYTAGQVDSEIRYEPEGKIIPAISVAIHAGKFERTTMNQWTGKISPSLLVLFQSKGFDEEEPRRAGVHPILEGVMMLLAGNTLGGVCKPLDLRSFKEEEIEKYSQAGYLAFRILLETTITIEAQDPDEGAEDLKKLVLSYYLRPEDDPETDDARVEDVVSLN